MKKPAIIWDFDGTLLPNDPYDSEQSLLIFQMQLAACKFPFHKKIATRAVIYADRKEWLPGNYFKWPYVRLLKNTPIHALDRVAEKLAEKIPKIDRGTIRELSQRGYNMLVISCGTADLSQRVLAFAGIDNCFSHILANRFTIRNSRIAGMRYSILAPEDKLAALQARHVYPETCIAVGDGYTDIPLLDRVKIPILLDRTGGKRRLAKTKGYHVITAIPELIQHRVVGTLVPRAPHPKRSVSIHTVRGTF